MTTQFNPNQLDQYRRSTDRGVGSLGVPMKRYCTACGHYKRLDAGHKRYPAFMCADCVTAKKAATLDSEHQTRHAGYGPDEV